jgi:hypothetical protein
LHDRGQDVRVAQSIGIGDPGIQARLASPQGLKS